LNPTGWRLRGGSSCWHCCCDRYADCRQPIAYEGLPPGPTAIAAAHLFVFAFAVPGILFGSYFAGLAVTGGIRQPNQLWTGAIVAAGLVSLLVSCLVLPAASLVDPKRGSELLKER